MALHSRLKRFILLPQVVLKTIETNQTKITSYHLQHLGNGAKMLRQLYDQYNAHI